MIQTREILITKVNADSGWFGENMLGKLLMELRQEQINSKSKGKQRLNGNIMMRLI